jgi:uncharacterized flavoprotein (TIGR03862 family)
VVGGGPAGLAASEGLLAAGCAVDLYDAMPSVGRKFLLAGKGGMNLTHAEGRPGFDARYGLRAAEVGRWLDRLDNEGLRAWAAGLGVHTFVGSSGRVFPTDMKAAPLLRAWLHRLREAGLRLHARHRWTGWETGRVDVPGDAARDGHGGAAATTAPPALRLDTPTGPLTVQADAVVLALGGASWARLGSDGAWVGALQAAGAEVAPLQPANCGFDVGWSEFFADRFAGAPMKSVALAFTAPDGRTFARRGEFVITATGIEGSLVYAAGHLLRDTIATTGSATLHLDLCADKDEAALARSLARGRGSKSLSNHLREAAGLDGAKAALLREGLDAAALNALAAQPAAFAARLKAWPLTLRAPRPIDEAISTAGGVRLESLDEGLMLRACPGVFCVGEMLDWEAPTGGYLLTACFASARVAADGCARWLSTRSPS